VSTDAAENRRLRDLLAMRERTGIQSHGACCTTRPTCTAQGRSTVAATQGVQAGSPVIDESGVWLARKIRWCPRRQVSSLIDW
jgi:hypothetical protein